MKPLAIALTLLMGAAAFAGYSYLPFKNVSTASDPFAYYVDSRSSSPGGVSLGLAQAAADQAWARWNEASCAAPKSVSLGLTGSVVVSPGDPNNGVNVTPVFITSTSDPDYARTLGTSYVTGIAIPLSYSGVLINCNIFLNGSPSAYSKLSTATPTPHNAVDVETVMLHEAGHCLGLDHFSYFENGQSNVMSAAIFPGEQKRVLQRADVAALCERNPVAGAIGSPCYDGGTCDVGGLCYTQNLADGPSRFCTRGCDVNAGEACPVPLTCTATTGIPLSSGGCLFPSGNVTPVGKPCTNDTECVSSVGTCLKPEASASGRTQWVAGYCSQTCEAGQPACPAGSTCTTMSDHSRKCLASCRPGLADCRSDYACVLTTLGGVCAPMCYADIDCLEATVTCRTCDGVCVAKQTPSAQIGDLCAQDVNCGAGQTCTVVSLVSSDPPQCTLQCGRGCGTCPTGSSCVATPKGLNCLRLCTGPNTCPQGLRCADFSSAKGCVPVCRGETDCPVGQHCLGGECLSDIGPDDGGCGTLCEVVDGGRPIVPVPKDAGIGNTTPPPPCGCQTSAGSMFVLCLGLALLVWARRST